MRSVALYGGNEYDTTKAGSFSDRRHSSCVGDDSDEADIGKNGGPALFEWRGVEANGWTMEGSIVVGTAGRTSQTTPPRSYQRSDLSNIITAARRCSRRVYAVRKHVAVLSQQPLWQEP